MSEIKLSPEAFRAVMSSVLTGPNCTTRGSLVSYSVPKIPVSLSSLSKYLDEGPDSFLTVYAATNSKFKSKRQGATIKLEASDVAWAYCLDHIAMVRVGELIFKNEGASASYFSMLCERGFALNEVDLPSYLYSCVGKPGRINSLKRGFATVITDHCVLSGIVVSRKTRVGDWVVMHFATAVTTLLESEAKMIQEEQQKNPWFKSLIASCPREIDYYNFCGGNLSAYAKKRLKMLNSSWAFPLIWSRILKWFRQK